MTKLKDLWTNNKLFIISIVCYMLITLPSMLNHIPWYDEAHAYMQASFMNFSNWIDIIKIEGHPLLWFLIIMPFAKAHWHYPYPMLIINYITCFAALFVMWKAAPFNKWLKGAITFSGMFIIYFPIVARGYSLGILFLFLLAVLYKNKLQHPFLYPILVGLTLNLNIICGIGASWFGLIYFIELLQSNLNKKTKIISSAILVLFTICFLFPFLGGAGTEATREYHSALIRIGNMKHFFLHPAIRILLYTASVVLIFIKTHLNKELTLIIYTDILLFCLFLFFYPGGPHHFIFIFIYLIIFLWIYNDKLAIQDKNVKLDFLSVIIMIIFWIPLPHNMSYVYYGHKMHAKLLIQKFNTEQKYRNSRLFIYEREALIIPYLKDDIEIYNACNTKSMNWDMFDTHSCIDYNTLTQALKDKNKNSFLINQPDIHSNQFDKEFKIYEFLKENNKTKEK